MDIYQDFIVCVDDFDAQIAAEDVINQVVVWFDGCSEIGARALGHRSIISIATSLETKNKINTIKKRQFWRPVTQ